MTNETFGITQTTRKSLPIQGLPFSRIKDDVLGETYELSLVFIGSALSRTLNYRYRKKDTPTNILSFPLSETEGEIYITAEKAEKEARLCGMSKRIYLLFLFIHGILHLKGLQHGGKMEREEAELLDTYRPRST